MIKPILFLMLALLAYCFAPVSFAEKQGAPTLSVGADTLQKGKQFLAENKTKKGIVVLRNGLQYKVLVKGKGKRPSITDRVTVNYEGKLIDGHIFDSSYARGRPITFSVNGVIQGWQQALQKMREGATWMLYIPSALAYGPRGIPGVIAPNSVLIFKVQLLHIVL